MTAALPYAAPPPLDVDGLEAGLLRREPAALGRAITLLESRRPDHQALAGALIARLMPRAGAAMRIGISGVPGVGKSTFIESLGCMLITRGHRVAVLAVDPSSSRSGGSILGDKTRMPKLAAEPGAFIRPSPSSGRLGGVGRATREAMLVVEAAGFDVVLVETVGTGQNETVVAEMVDLFLVLMLPGAGDELQGIKKGILELADIVAVNKADGGNRDRAVAAAHDYESALRILSPRSPHWQPQVALISGLTGAGLPELWAMVEDHRRRFEAAGALAALRSEQQVRWMWSMLEDRLLQSFREDAAVRARLAETEASVAAGRLPAPDGAERLLALFQRIALTP